MMRKAVGIVASDPSPTDKTESTESDASRFLLIILRGQEPMGITDQRGDWRRVVTDGNRQAQGKGEQPLAVEAGEATPAGEQRGIRLLPDSEAARTPGRVGPASDRPLSEGTEPD